MNERLQAALSALRYDPTAKPNGRINLLFSINAHAILVGDKEMQDACAAEIAKVQEEKRQAAERAIATPAPPAVEGKQ